MATDVTLPEVVQYVAEKFGVPGLAVAVWHDGTELFAAHGVTNLENPRPVDENTLYATGSTSKPFAATALMHLVAQGKVELDAPVRRYIPELALPNEDWTAHSMDDVLARPAASGHNAGENGELAVAREWKDNRANNGGAGIASSVSDLLRWARFHLGDKSVVTGPSADAAEVLSDAVRLQMQVPTVEIPSSTLGDAFGLCWFLKDISGVRTVGHGGSGNGQFVDFLLVPERGFAIVSAANAGSAGVPCNTELVRWALDHYLGVAEKDPEPEPYDAARATEIAGAYENDAMTFTIAADGKRTSRSCTSLSVSFR